jgi:xanthine dehydrogenase YagR molybdenum-binding subunit
LPSRVVGTPLDRLDGPEKVTGAAKYAYEYPADRVSYVAPVQSTVARGRVLSVDDGAALEVDQVLAVLTHKNAPELEASDDHDLAIMQSDAIVYRGQIVAAVVAETPEIAVEAAGLVIVHYEQLQHDVELRADRDDLYAPESMPDTLRPLYPTDSVIGNIDAALQAAPIALDLTYTTPAQHNNPMEPRATQAVWSDDGQGVTIHDTNSGAYFDRNEIAIAFGLDPERVHVIATYVGGQFGSKAGSYPHVILTVMAAKVVNRPAKLALTRQQMFTLAGYRTPTIQRLQLGADLDGTLTAIAHDVIEQTSFVYEYTEKTAVVSRTLYAAPNRRTTHRLARVNLPANSWMRAPGEAPGLFALESAMDELAVAAGVDPIELRVRNEPAVHPESGLPFSSRGLLACMRRGAQRFGWAERDPRTGARREGSWMVGSGVSASTYPCFQFPASAQVRANPGGRYEVRIAASDPGPGSSTVLVQIVADALEVPVETIHLEIGDSSFPPAMGTAGSSGTASWGWAVLEAAQQLRRRLRDEFGGIVPPEGLLAEARIERNPNATRFSMNTFGAQFAEVRVNEDTGEVRVAHLLGVFAAGRIVNPKTARSQFLGGMTFGLSMALHEQSLVDPRDGDFVNHDLAGYHVATSADVDRIEAFWIEEDDLDVNPMGTKGIGEIGNVGTAAAIANAVYHATGVRVRDLPITPEKVLLPLLARGDP